MPLADVLRKSTDGISLLSSDSEGLLPPTAPEALGLFDMTDLGCGLLE